MTIGDAPDPFDLLAPLPPKKPPVAEAAELPERAPVVPETAPSSSMLQHAEAKLAGEHATPSGGGAAGDDVPATGAIAEMIRDAVESSMRKFTGNVANALEEITSRLTAIEGALEANDENVKALAEATGELKSLARALERAVPEESSTAAPAPAPPIAELVEKLSVSPTPTPTRAPEPEPESAAASAPPEAPPAVAVGVPIVDARPSPSYQQNLSPGAGSWAPAGPPPPQPHGMPPLPQPPPSPAYGSPYGGGGPPPPHHQPHRHHHPAPPQHHSGGPPPPHHHSGGPPPPPPPPSYDRGPSPPPPYRPGPPPGRHAPPASLQNTQVKVSMEKIVDDFANMGFTREQVRGVIRQMQDAGQPVDLNVVLDRLMNPDRYGGRR